MLLIFSLYYSRMSFFFFTVMQSCFEPRVYTITQLHHLAKVLLQPVMNCMNSVGLLSTLFPKLNVYFHYNAHGSIVHSDRWHNPSFSTKLFAIALKCPLKTTILQNVIFFITIDLENIAAQIKHLTAWLQTSQSKEVLYSMCLSLQLVLVTSGLIVVLSLEFPAWAAHPQLKAVDRLKPKAHSNCLSRVCFAVLLSCHRGVIMLFFFLRFLHWKLFRFKLLQFEGNCQPVCHLQDLQAAVQVVVLRGEN